jgi:hypothetical protein
MISQVIIYILKGRSFYERLLGQVVNRCIDKLFSLPRGSGFTFSVVQIKSNQGEVYEHGINQTRTPD